MAVVVLDQEAAVEMEDIKVRALEEIQVLDKVKSLIINRTRL